MEAVIRAGMPADFSGDFGLFSHRKRLEVSRKSPEKSEDIPAGILLPSSGEFR
jgi:hypothetical protein